jgi:hypothetical protein
MNKIMETSTYMRPSMWENKYMKYLKNKRRLGMVAYTYNSSYSEGRGGSWCMRPYLENEKAKGPGV